MRTIRDVLDEAGKYGNIDPETHLALRKELDELVRLKYGERQLSDEVWAFIENLAKDESEPLHSAVTFVYEIDRAHCCKKIRERARALLSKGV